jgi:hypothetical protein
VKKIFLIGAALVVAVIFVQWRSHHEVFRTAGSSSQIFIHGTPVCVFTLGGSVVARVGQCPDTPETENEGPGEEAPFHGRPGMDLPPGHPPVDRDMLPEGPRTVPI